MSYHETDGPVWVVESSQYKVTFNTPSHIDTEEKAIDYAIQHSDFIFNRERDSLICSRKSVGG